MIWLDAHISPSMAVWIKSEFNIEAYSLSYLNLQFETDYHIFMKAKEKNAIVMTKDADFVNLLDIYNAPPKIIWLTCGNTSVKALKEILIKTLKLAIADLKENDLIEII